MSCEHSESARERSIAPYNFFVKKGWWVGGVLLSVAGSIPGKNKTVTLTFIHGYLYMVIVPIYKRTVMNGTSPNKFLRTF